MSDERVRDVPISVEPAVSRITSEFFRSLIASLGYDLLAVDPRAVVDFLISTVS